MGGLRKGITFGGLVEYLNAIKTAALEDIDPPMTLEELNAMPVVVRVHSEIEDDDVCKSARYAIKEYEARRAYGDCTGEGDREAAIACALLASRDELRVGGLFSVEMDAGCGDIEALVLDASNDIDEDDGSDPGPGIETTDEGC